MNRSGGWKHIAGAPALVIVLLAVLAAGARAASPDPDPAVPAAERAVAQAMERRGTSYVGDCAGTRSPDAISKVCSKFVASQGDVYAFETGLSFSEFSQWIFVQASGTGWSVVAIVPFDETATGVTVPWPRTSTAS